MKIGGELMKIEVSVEKKPKRNWIIWIYVDLDTPLFSQSSYSLYLNIYIYIFMYKDPAGTQRRSGEIIRHIIIS